jgi:5-formyltetrahydrofolate cyclo-ligase
MAALWGGPAIRLRGIHVNPQSKQAKSALATAPFMLEWLQLGIMEIYLPTPQAVLLPTPLSPGVKLTVKDVYLRMRTYGTSLPNRSI